MDLPEPLTPIECDLRGLPFMPLDVVRLVDSNLFALTSGDEFKAAVTLWCKAWLQVPAASLPDDDRVLSHLSCTGTAWKKLRAMALHGWIKCSDGRLYHPVVADKACQAWKHRLAQRDRAAKRWNKPVDAPEPPHGIAAEHAAAYATALPMALPTEHAVALPADMQGRGRVKDREEIEERTELRSDAAAASPCQIDPILPVRDRLWGEGMPIIRQITGKSESQCRALLGRWLRTAKDDCARLLAVLRDAESLRPIDPIPWVERAVASTLNRRDNASRVAEELGITGSIFDEEPTRVVPFPVERRLA